MQTPLTQAQEPVVGNDQSVSCPYVSQIAYSERVELLPLVLTSSWASGINAYTVITMLGLLGRYGGLDQVPESCRTQRS